MKRRQFLMGAAGGSVLITGCLDGNEPMAQESGHANDPVENIEAARDALIEAAELFDNEIEKFDTVDDDMVDIQTDRIEQLLDVVDTELDTAEEKATGEQLEAVEKFRDFAELLSALTATMATAGDVADEWSVGFSYWERGRFVDAADQMTVVQDLVDDARQDLTITRERYKKVEEHPDDYDIEAMDHMDQMDEWLFAMNIVADGYRDLALGFDHVMSAAEAYDNERWEKAADGFSTANERFVSAKNAFHDGEDRVARTMRPHFIGFTCIAESLSDGTEAYQESALAASRNDWETANEKAEEAERAMDRC